MSSRLVITSYYHAHHFPSISSPRDGVRWRTLGGIVIAGEHYYRWGGALLSLGGGGIVIAGKHCYRWGALLSLGGHYYRWGGGGALLI